VTPPGTDRQPLAGSGSSGGTVTAVVRTADVLSFLAQAPPRPVGVTEIANGLGLSMAVVFSGSSPRCGRAATWSSMRGAGATCSARRASSSAWPTSSAPTPAARSTMRSSPCRPGVRRRRTGWERMYVDQILPPDDVKMVVPIGRLFPLHAGASSKAFLAFLPEAGRERFFAEHTHLPALTERTVVTESALRAELEEIRAAGFASSLGERQHGAAFGRRADPRQQRRPDGGDQRVRTDRTLRGAPAGRGPAPARGDHASLPAGPPRLAARLLSAMADRTAPDRAARAG
jgi:IclR family transcriptional regulator, acetate operon repressor